MFRLPSDFKILLTVFNQSYNCHTSHYLGRNRLPNAFLMLPSLVSTYTFSNFKMNAIQQNSILHLWLVIFLEYIHPSTKVIYLAVSAKIFLTRIFLNKCYSWEKRSWWLGDIWHEMAFSFFFSLFFQCRDCFRVDLKDLSCYSWINKIFALMLLFSYWYFVTLLFSRTSFTLGQANCVKRFSISSQTDLAKRRWTLRYLCDRYAWVFLVRYFCFLDSIFQKRLVYDLLQNATKKNDMSFIIFWPPGST